MRHLKVIVISACMAVPFGIAIYQDSKRSEKDHLRSMLDVASGDEDEFDYGDGPKEAALREQLARMEALRERQAEADLEADPEEAADEPPPSLDESSIRQLLGAHPAEPGLALRGLFLGMKATDVTALPDAMMTWLDDGSGPFDAQLSLEYAGPNDAYVAGITVAFSDYGKALEVANEQWGASRGNDELPSWEGAPTSACAPGAPRAVLTHSDATNRTELLFACSATATQLFAPREKRRLGFERKPILGTTKRVLLEAYQNAIEDGETLILELPAFIGSTGATTDAEIAFDDGDKASEIKLRLDHGDNDLLEQTVLSALEEKYGAPAETPESYDHEYGKPTKVGVTELDGSLLLYFVR